MEGKLYYTVAEDYEGNVTIASYFGRNKAEERKFALTTNRKVLLVTSTLEEAKDMARRVRVAVK